MDNLSFADVTKRNLKNAITYITDRRAEYVHNPDADFTRERKLNMHDTMSLLLSMDGGSLAKELHKHFEQRNASITPSALVQQRSKIKSEAFHDLLRQFNQTEVVRSKYKGYRVLAVDGSAINQPRDPNLESFFCKSNDPHGFNQTHMSAVYDVLNKTVLDVELQPRPKMDEHKALIAMLQRNNFQGRNIVLLDRGYEGYNLFAHLIEKENIDFLCRVKNGNGGLRKIQKLPMQELDRDISFEITTTQTNEDKEAQRIRIPTASPKGNVESSLSRIRTWDFQSPYTM